MNLPFLKHTEPQKNFFLSLLYKPYKVSAILFEEINSKLFILATSDQESSKNADELTAEELLNLSDRVITNVEPSLPEGASVEKTIFSVPYEWVSDGKITQEYLDKLKKVCQDLGLVPVGYLISIEAIISHLEHKEGAPVSAIFVEVAVKRIIIYLVRAGKILEVHSGEIEKGVLPTVESLFKQIDVVDVLPSRIILLDYKNASTMQQDFLSHTWKDIPFLHLPQVLVLEKGFEDEAAVNGVAIQMDLEVLHDSKALKAAEMESITSEDSKSMGDESSSVGEKIEEATPEEFGFIKEKDVAEEKAEVVVDDTSMSEVSSIDENIEPVIKEAGKSYEESNIASYKKEDADIQDMDPETPSATSGLPFLSLLPALPKMPNFEKIKMPNVKILQFLKTGNSSMKIKAGIALLLFFVVIIIVSFVYYGVFLQVNVSVFSDKKEVSKTQDITFSESPTSSSSIKIDIVEEEEKGDDTKNATGTKDTGDKAAGTVIIYNKTESEKAFPKGTVVVGPNNLEFETQGDVKIASTSAFSTNLSSASVKVNASKFGKEYNLPSGSNFTIKGSSASNYIAKNSDALSGGSKKTITVVSQKDLDDLLEQVESKLEKQAIDAVRQKASSSDVLPSALSIDVVDKNYTKKVGAESGSVGISADIKYSIGTYNKSDLKNVVDAMSSGQIPGTYKIDMDNSKIEVTDIKVVKDGTAKGTLKVNATYIPEIDSSKLASEIKSKSESQAIKTIKDINGVTDVVINFSRKLPLFPNLMPANTKNINVEVKK